MANRRFIDFPIAASVGDNDIVLIWQDGLNKQTTKATLFAGSPNSLAGLTDVDISALANGQILQYNSTTSKWENVDRTDIDLDELGDVTIVSPTNGQVLVYNSSTSKWENSSAGFVPYTGAVTTVNLGAQSILAGSFVKAGGTSAQFLKADGSVDSTAYGTGSVTSVALTMPTAFSVANSPITTAGTLAVTGAGTVAQYVRGDGSLADFPATTGGGASVSYYLNGSVSQGTIGGVAYREFNRNPVFGAGTDISISSDGYIANFITDAGDPNKLLIPAGNWNLETYFSASSSGGSPTFYVELYKYDGSTFTLIASSATSPELIAFGTNLNPYFSTLAVPQTTLALTDRLALRYYVNTSGRTITLHTENNHLCQVITTFTTGLTALNGLTTQVQFFAVGSSGTDFNIASATDTHTFNLPTASSTNRGALSSSDWTTFNNKQNALTNPVTGTGSAGQVAYWSSGSAITGESNLFWDSSNDRLGIGITPSYSLDVNGKARFANNVAINGDTTDIAGFTSLNINNNSNGSFIDLSNNSSTNFRFLTLSSVDQRIQASGSLRIDTGGFQSLIIDSSGVANFTNKIIARSATTSASLGQVSVIGAGEFMSSGSFAGIFWENRSGGVTSTSNWYGWYTSAGIVRLYNGSTDIVEINGSTGAASFDSSVTATSIIKSGGTSAQFLKADGSVDSTTYVSNVTASSPLASSGGSTPNITIQQASGSQNGFLSSTDWTTFNNKQNALTNPVTGTGVSGRVAFWNGTNTITSDSDLLFSGTTLTLLAGNVEIAAGNGLILFNPATTNYFQLYTNSSNELNFGFGGTNPRMTITSSGRLLIGSPPPTESTFTLDVNGGARFTNSTRVDGSFVITQTNTPQQSILLNDIATNGNTLGLLSFGGRWNSTTYANGSQIRATAVGTWSSTNYGTNLALGTVAENSTTLNTRMTILNNGNVGIGTVTPTIFSNNTTLAINNSGGGAVLELQSNGTSAFRMATSSTDSALWEPRNVPILFATNNTERMRITSVGRGLFGTTTASAGASGFAANSFQVKDEIVSIGSTSGIFWENRSGGVTASSNWYGWYASTGTIFLFNGSANAASINPSTGIYTPLSDKNKKKDFEQSNLGLNEILNLKPTLYRMNSDSEDMQKQLGFLAQEVKEYIPQAYVESEGFIGLNYNSIIPVLVNAIKELKQEINTLKS